MLLDFEKKNNSNSSIEKIFNPIINLNDNTYLPSVFFLILTISGNFLAETFSCSTRKLLSKNFLAKHILLFSVIYFTSSINSKDKTNPLDKLKQAFIIYLFFTMFSKMNLFFTIVGFGILTSIYVSSDYVNYMLNNKKQINPLIPNLKNLLRIGLLIWTIVGFIFYIISKNNKYKDKFSLYNLFFSEKYCKF